MVIRDVRRSAMLLRGMLRLREQAALGYKRKRTMLSTQLGTVRGSSTGPGVYHAENQGAEAGRESGRQAEVAVPAAHAASVQKPAQGERDRWRGMRLLLEPMSCHAWACWK